MKIYTFSEARQKLSDLLNKVESEGEVIIKRHNGRQYRILPYNEDKSPLDLPGINIDITRKDIVEAIHKVRD